jgi:hypothetical protein
MRHELTCYIVLSREGVALGSFSDEDEAFVAALEDADTMNHTVTYEITKLSTLLIKRAGVINGTMTV